MNRFAATQAALLAGDFVTARNGLEDLSRDPRHADLFCDASAYLAMFPAVQHQPLIDRLRAADSTARRNRSSL